MEKIVDHAQMLENMPMVVMRLYYENGLWKTWFVSKNVERYGYAQRDFLDGTITWNDMLHPDDRVMANTLADEYIRRSLDDFRLHYRIVTTSGETVWIAEYSHINRNPDGSVQCVDTVLLNTTEAKTDANQAKDPLYQQVVMNDILLSLHDADLEKALRIIFDNTAKKQYEENIKRLAFQDHLTNLPNRFRCDIDLQNTIESSIRTGQPGYLFFIDLDDFKIVNDCYGHDYGDGVLISFANYLREKFAGDNRVYRFGGDEFVIIINHANAGKAHAYLEEMIDRARKPWSAFGKEFYCTLSIGVVEFPRYGEDPKSVVKKADIAMYHAKKSGKNSYALYTEGLDSATLRRSEMELLLRNAMLNDFHGFEVHYQFYSDTAHGLIAGAEALVRLRDPDDRLLLPEQFLSLAEYLGLIGPLGDHVLATAAAECRIINESGMPDFTITVNLSPKQFKQRDIVSRLEKILVNSGVELKNVIIAINEGVAIGELERMLTLCDELRKKGIMVALDDFGSGSSSFINMRNLPVDIVKVSSRYIDDIDDRFTGYFLRLVTDLSHFTHKKVCVNGVETRQQFDFCKKMGVDMVQGFLLHRPENIASLKQILAKGLGLYV